MVVVKETSDKLTSMWQLPGTGANSGKNERESYG